MVGVYVKQFIIEETKIKALYKRPLALITLQLCKIKTFDLFL